MTDRLKVCASAVWTVFCLAGLSWSDTPSHQATGVLVGEVDQTSAIVWTRYTQNPVRSTTDGSCPGANGYVRVRYGGNSDLSGAVTTAWQAVSSSADFSREIMLTGLAPDTTYHYAVDTDADGVGTAVDVPGLGTFKTAPVITQTANVRFAVVTGMRYDKRVSGEEDGWQSFVSIKNKNPDFVVPTGDTVYYDYASSFNGETLAPIAESKPLARYRWDRTLSLQRVQDLFRSTSVYFEKDDHDVVKDDCDTEDRLGGLTFDQGKEVFLEKVPMGDNGPTSTYRTVRWGKDLQVWFAEGRDFRDDSKSDPGTPDNYPTIWGETQKQWFKDSVAASDATWKILVSPTPRVGPDYKYWDNHAYTIRTDRPACFKYEGAELRNFMSATAPADMFVVCGDRHWQYHSIDPASQLHEFSCGTPTDQWSSGGGQERAAFHRYFMKKGGFLTVDVESEPGMGRVIFTHHYENGDILYQWRKDVFRPGDEELGTLSISGLMNDANFKLQVDETGCDLVQVTGNLDLGDPTDLSPATLRQTDLLIRAPSEPLPVGRYTLITYSGFLTGSFARILGLPADATLDYSINHQIDLVVPGAALEVSTNAVTVPEGGTNSFGIRLTRQPENEVTVTVRKVSGDTSISVQHGSALTFATHIWDVWQYPVLAASSDDDWANSSAVVRCSAPNMLSVEITVTEDDDEPDPGYALPWSESFENNAANAGALGALDGQHGWVADAGAVVTNSGAQSGEQALLIAEATASHTFEGASANVWVEFWAKPVRGAVAGTITGNASAVFFVNTNDNLMVYSNTTSLMLSNKISNDWNKFAVQCDYVSKVWNLKLNDDLVGSNLAFYSALGGFGAIELQSLGTGQAWFDRINIAVSQGGDDTDGDGLPNWWENTYYGSDTAADPIASASNGVNSVYQAYIAGFDPTDPDSGFSITDYTPGAQHVIQWSGVSGRVYTVYWASNLLSGFQTLETNRPWTSAIFTDTTHRAEEKGFYKIDVKIEP